MTRETSAHSICHGEAMPESEAQRAASARPIGIRGVADIEYPANHWQRGM